MLDGEILAWKEGRPLPFAVLQRRIGRKKLTEKVLAEAPAVFLAFDLLELGGQDLREAPLAERRAGLEKLLAEGRPFLLTSPGGRWIDLGGAGAGAGGGAGARRRGGDVVAPRLPVPHRPQAGGLVEVEDRPLHPRRRAGLRPVRSRPAGHSADRLHLRRLVGGELVPVAKAYSGLSDEEILTLDGWLRRHTLQKFGPVRAVEPVQVFELAFEGIARSPRHKSGLAVRFPRIARWRTDKTPEQADRLEEILALLASASS